MDRDQVNNAITSAVQYFQGQRSKKADPNAVVKALVAAEKQARRHSKLPTFKDLQGNWRLAFITGTQKARQNAGAALGAGRFLPSILDIRIQYIADANQNPEAGDSEVDGAITSDRGTVNNSVRVGPLTFCVSGPIAYFTQQRILAFDFTHLAVTMTDVELYSGDIRGGQTGSQAFHDLPLKERPFFTYFYVSETAIAARGKGGGLALWVKA